MFMIAIVIVVIVISNGVILQFIHRIIIIIIIIIVMIELNVSQEILRLIQIIIGAIIPTCMHCRREYMSAWKS